MVAKSFSLSSLISDQLIVFYFVFYEHWKKILENKNLLYYNNLMLKD